MQIFDNVRSQYIRLGQAVEVGKGLVLDPEYVQARLIPLQDLLDIESAEPAIRVILRPSLCPLVAVFRVIALDKNL